MAAYVGLDPAVDIEWVVDPATDSRVLFEERRVDAFLSFPPLTQELRAAGTGHIIASSAVDRPWSQYFCCMLTGNPDFVRNNPIATKRVVRALVKGADICADEPQRAARNLVENGFADSYDFALEALQDLGYRAWRDFDPADTARFYALRMRELGMIDLTPNEALATHTDWRFLDELRRELHHAVETEALGVFARELVREQRDVLAALAQCGHEQLDHRDAVIQIFAETTRFDLGEQVAMGAREQAHIDLFDFCRAEWLHFALLQHAQQLRLQRQRQLADLI